MVVCHCKAVNDSSIVAPLHDRRLTIEDVATSCGAGTDCGGCLETIRQLIESAAAVESAAVG